MELSWSLKAILLKPYFSKNLLSMVLCIWLLSISWWNVLHLKHRIEVSLFTGSLLILPYCSTAQRVMMDSCDVIWYNCVSEEENLSLRHTSAPWWTYIIMILWYEFLQALYHGAAFCLKIVVHLDFFKSRGSPGHNVNWPIKTMSLWILNICW